MKLAPFLLLAIFLVWPARTGQSQSRTKKEAPSLDLGSVTVSLGMPKKDVLKKLSDESYEVIETGENKSLVTRAGHVYSLRFRNGLLTYADREWYNKDSEEVDAILGGLGSLADQRTYEPCSVVHSPLSDPDISGDRIFIACGQRTLLIGKFKLQGKVSMTVSESIGELPTKQQ